MLLELAALRRGIEALVLVSPDRHGGDPRHWRRIADGFAARGFAVLVIAGTAASTALDAHAPTPRARIGRPRIRRSATIRRARPASAAPLGTPPSPTGGILS
ncbi:hypothetical protein E1I21_02285 [Microbacterium oleivorans]|nr:hypothetical protein E1I21_02285 [Microbacterium oleivorans]